MCPDAEGEVPLSMAAGGGVLAVESANTHPQGLAVGDEVLAFYHANAHPRGYRYARVFERTQDFPIVGLTSGWLPAVVVDSFKPTSLGQRVHVLFPGTFRHPHEGYCEGVELMLPQELVKPLPDCASPPRRPLLSIVAFRWFDYWSNMRWSDYCVTNDGMLVDLFDGPCSVGQQLPGDFEVYTVFVRRTEDLRRIDPVCLRSLLRGVNITAWYFLWPVLHGDVHSLAGCIRERELFLLCQHMEREAIRGGWPHPSHLYRLLCGKLWLPQMCLNQDYRLPPTVHLHYSEFRLAPWRAARRAAASIMEIRRRVWKKQPMPLDDFAGVVKLGFSWQGDDVLPFRGLDSLVANVRRLYERPSSEQTRCLVQEMVPRVVGEHRVLVFRDAERGLFRRECLWLRMKRRGRHHQHGCDLGEFSLASASVAAPGDVGRELFGGDCCAQQAAEEQARSGSSTGGYSGSPRSAQSRRQWCGSTSWSRTSGRAAHPCGRARWASAGHHCAPSRWTSGTPRC